MKRHGKIEKASVISANHIQITADFRPHYKDNFISRIAKDFGRIKFNHTKRHTLLAIFFGNTKIGNGHFHSKVLTPLFNVRNFALWLSNRPVFIMSETKYITLEQARRDNRSLLRLAVEAATRAANALSLHEDLPGIYVDEPSGYTVKWLQKSIEIHVKAIKSDPTLTAEQRADYLQRWRNIKKSALRHVDTIQRFTENWPEVKWERGSDELFYVAEEEIDRVAEQRATLPVPSELQEQWQRLNNVLKELRELREWETNNGLTHPELRTISSMTECKFYDCALSARLSGVAERYRQRQEQKLQTHLTII